MKYDNVWGKHSVILVYLGGHKLILKILSRICFRGPALLAENRQNRLSPINPGTHFQKAPMNNAHIHPQRSQRLREKKSQRHSMHHDKSSYADCCNFFHTLYMKIHYGSYFISSYEPTILVEFNRTSMQHKCFPSHPK